MILNRDQQRLLKHLRKMENYAKFLDSTVRKVAEGSNRRLKETTNASKLIRAYKGSTRNAWGSHKKVADSVYKNENISKSDDKKHLIVNILNYGRGVVRPKRAKALYIPLTGKGRKKWGDPITKGIIYGKDFIFTQKSSAFKGTKFIDKEITKSAGILMKQTLKTLDREIKKK